MAWMKFSLDQLLLLGLLVAFISGLVGGFAVQLVHAVIKWADDKADRAARIAAARVRDHKLVPTWPSEATDP